MIDRIQSKYNVTVTRNGNKSTLTKNLANAVKTCKENAAAPVTVPVEEAKDGDAGDDDDTEEEQQQQEEEEDEL